LKPEKGALSEKSRSAPDARYTALAQYRALGIKHSTATGWAIMPGDDSQIQNMMLPVLPVIWSTTSHRPFMTNCPQTTPRNAGRRFK